MSDTPQGAGWLPDPTRRYARRYFDGSTWTDDVANEPGKPAIDPFHPLPPQPGWWEASDGNWYPPAGDLRPPPPAMPIPPRVCAEEACGATPAPGRPYCYKHSADKAPQATTGAGAGCLLVVVGIIIVAVMIGALSGGDDGGQSGQDELEFGAFDVCQDFVKGRLRSPSTASFPNFFEDDGEVVVTAVGDNYTVRSQVDAQNGFGATITNQFTCEVRHTGENRYVLVDLRIT